MEDKFVSTCTFFEAQSRLERQRGKGKERNGLEDRAHPPTDRVCRRAGGRAGAELARQVAVVATGRLTFKRKVKIHTLTPTYNLRARTHAQPICRRLDPSRHRNAAAGAAKTTSRMSQLHTNRLRWTDNDCGKPKFCGFCALRRPQLAHHFDHL